LHTRILCELNQMPQGGNPWFELIFVNSVTQLIVYAMSLGVVAH